MFAQCLAHDAQKIAAEIMTTIILFILIIVNIIIQLETKHLLKKRYSS